MRRASDDVDPREVFVRRFAQDFDLDQKQKALLRLVLEEQDGQRKDWFDRLQRSSSPEEQASLRKIERRADDYVRALLRPEQLAKYEARLKRD